MSDQLIYPVRNIIDNIFASHAEQGLYMNQTYAQLLYGTQSSGTVLTGDVYFNQRFIIPYSVSTSSDYYAIAQQMGAVTENNWNLVPYQKVPGIWKTPSFTGDTNGQQICSRAQQVKISKYYYGDEIANGSFRSYFFPSVTTASGSLSSLQTQNVLRFININKDFFGPSFSLSGNNLSASTSGLTVDMMIRPIPQLHSGYLWHRWTTDGTSPISNYAQAATGSISSYEYYATSPYYGIGCRFNYLSPVSDADMSRPFLDFYVYGQLSGATGNYVDLQSGLINQAANTRFYLSQEEINLLFDGSFHNLRFAWSTQQEFSNGKIYLDGISLSGIARGTGRTTDVNYTVSGSASSTPFYIQSQCDDPSQLVKMSSKSTMYAETKHVLLFDAPLSSSFANPSVSSTALYASEIKSLTGNLCNWYAFNDSPPGPIGVDVAPAYTTHVSTSYVGFIANDKTNKLEGSIAPIFSLMFDKSGSYWNSVYDSYSTTGQRVVGKLYCSEYGGATETMPIGAIFYDKGNALILNDYYNTDYGISTQLFSSSTGSFGVVGSVGATWQLPYLYFIGVKFINRKSISLTANAEHFTKTRNESGNFLGSDNQVHPKSNTKMITGVIFFDKSGVPAVITKFSEPIVKPEHHDVVINLNVDL